MPKPFGSLRNALKTRMDSSASVFPVRHRRNRLEGHSGVVSWLDSLSIRRPTSAPLHGQFRRRTHEREPRD